MLAATCETLVRSVADATTTTGDEMEFYSEVAHIKPVSQNGQSVLGNLIVLCPNHHKEFDFGDLKINEQTNSKLAGQLNGNSFEIELTYHD